MDPTVEGRKTVDNEDSIRHLISSNQARSVVLLGVPIVALVMEGQERLCLAQISNTLLKKFSYNEIHNRRVALGITCVQCTPVQLEVLRRAGAMPISSRRCGMITKREAERLCKSFLADSPPPKLPDDFEFVVAHKCAWGCRGSFLPSRYNSSRAKCLRCHSCDQYFSPNKFIFHSHRTGDSTYVQPDAANFNSWRRHLHLVDLTIPEGQLHAWEDVKAMFNGGSRKRVGGESSGSGHRQLQPKFDGGRGRRTAVVPPPPPRPIAPTSWSEMPPGSFLHLNNVIESAMTNPFCWGFPPPSSFLQLQPQPKVIGPPQQQFSDGQMSEMSSAPSAFRPVEVSLDLSLKRTAGRPSVKQDGNNDSNCSKANHN